MAGVELFIGHETLHRFRSLVFAFCIQLAVGNPGAGDLSIRMAGFPAASFDRDYHRRGVCAGSCGSVSAGATSWGTAARLINTLQDSLLRVGAQQKLL